ncbi:MAG: hypothetical protein ACOZAR_05115 [Patescibacteria group bacterium]
MKNNSESSFSGERQGDDIDKGLNRREFLKRLGWFGLGLAASGLGSGCEKQTADETIEVGELYDRINNKEKPVAICSGFDLVKAKGLSLEFDLNLEKFSEERLELIFPIAGSQDNYYLLDISRGIDGKCRLTDAMVYDDRTLVENDYTKKVNHEKVVTLRLLLDPTDNYIHNYHKENPEQKYKFISRINHNSIWREEKKKIYNVAQFPLVYREKMSDDLLIGVDNAANRITLSNQEFDKLIKDIYRAARQTNIMCNTWNKDLGLAVNQIIFYEPTDEIKGKNKVLSVLPATLYCYNQTANRKFVFLKNNIILSNKLLNNPSDAKKAVLYELVKQSSRYLFGNNETSLETQYFRFREINGQVVFDYRNDNLFGTVINTVDEDREIDVMKTGSVINDSVDMYASVVASMGYDFDRVVDKIERMSKEEDKKTMKGIIHSLINILGDSGEVIMGENYAKIKKYLQ